LGIQAELIKGSGGAFEVQLDGQAVFSKKTTGRFPNQNEVEDLLVERLET